VSGRATIALLVLAASLAGCATGLASSPAKVQSQTGGVLIPAPVTDKLTIYAAASLKSALAKVQLVYEATYPGTALTISTDSSTALEAKIEQGAPANVFLAADTANPQKLIDKGLAVGSVVRFATNLLTVIVPASNPAGIASLADLAKPGVKIVAAAEGVPIQTYTAQLVANLAQEPGYPAGFAAAYAANVISREDNVGAVAAKISLGEGDAAIVYATDATAWNHIAIVAVPADANVRATYGGVDVASTTSGGAGYPFLGWLAGPDGQAILASFGFGPGH
jgi:molybdate transport system substrate-binding protein